ncbi:MAG: hypothetical protein VX757_04760 [Planctomycetota bacterium]|nr:hypothetical protein [Planctomycetota bacterium]
MTETRWIASPGLSVLEIQDRRPGLAKISGIARLISGTMLGVLGFAAVWVGFDAGLRQNMVDAQFISRLAFGVGATIIPISLFVAAQGLLHLFGKRQIRIDKRSVSVVNRLGIIWSTRSVPLNQLAGLQIETPNGIGPSSLQGYSNLLALRLSGKSKILLRTIPDEVAHALAESVGYEISKQGHRPFAEGLTKSQPSSIPTETRSLNPLSLESRSAPPLGSDLRVNMNSKTSSLGIPRLGLKKVTEGGGKWFIACFLIGELFVLFGLIPALMMGKVNGQPIAGWGIALVSTLFSSALVALVANAATRRGQIEWKNPTLVFREWDMWGTHEQAWTRGEIQDISVGVSEGTSDGAPIWTYHVNITPNGLKERKWFSNRSKEELEWIVTTLCDWTQTLDRGDSIAGRD